MDIFILIKGINLKVKYTLKYIYEKYKNTRWIITSQYVYFTKPGQLEKQVSEHTIPFFFVNDRQALRSEDYLNSETRD